MAFACGVWGAPFAHRPQTGIRKLFDPVRPQCLSLCIHASPVSVCACAQPTQAPARCKRLFCFPADSYFAKIFNRTIACRWWTFPAANRSTTYPMRDDDLLLRHCFCRLFLLQLSFRAGLARWMCCRGTQLGFYQSGNRHARPAAFLRVFSSVCCCSRRACWAVSATAGPFAAFNSGPAASR